MTGLGEKKGGGGGGRGKIPVSWEPQSLLGATDMLGSHPEYNVTKIKKGKFGRGGRNGIGGETPYSRT